MLLSLQIENFALIDHLHLTLGEGLTVLTGETGAGKSIILDALDAVLGGKVSGRAVRTGAEKAVLEATFRLDAPLRQWLNDQAIALAGDTLVCSREIAAAPGSPRSRSRVNGAAVTKQQMDALRDRLVELTAQGQTVQLGEVNAQRDWLDHYGGRELMQQRDRVATAFAAFQAATQALEQRRRAEQQRLQQLDLFEYQLQDLNAANLTDGEELERLEQEAKRLVHSVELQQQSYAVYQALYQSDRDQVTCTDLLGQAERTLLSMVEYDEQLQPIVDLVTAALAQVEEAGREINAYGADIEADPQRLSEVQARITELKQICRKYGPDLAEAIALRDRLQQDVMEMTGGGQSIEDLEAAVADTQATLLDECAQLTQQRTTAALDLETRLVQELKPLAMEKVQFTVDLAPCAPTAAGADQVTFLFSPNPGEPLQPLTEIASGGEMSRFLLALQASFSQIDPVGTLVFDEIDAGVSGRVTQAIAEKLYHLSHHHQVLCVTHQPIVAAMADQHLHVSKHLVTDDGTEGGVDVTLSMTLDANGHSNGHANGHSHGQANGHTNGHKGKKTNGKRGRAAQNAPAADSPTAELTELTERSPDSSIRTVVRVNPLTTEERKHELALLAGGQLAQESSTATEAAAYTFAESLLTQAENLRRSPTTIADPVTVSPSATPTPRSSRAPGQAKRKETATAAIAKSSRHRSPKKSS